MIANYIGHAVEVTYTNRTVTLTDVHKRPNKDIVGVHPNGGLVTIGYADLPGCFASGIVGIEVL